MRVKLIDDRKPTIHVRRETGLHMQRASYALDIGQHLVFLLRSRNGAFGVSAIGTGTVQEVRKFVQDSMTTIRERISVKGYEAAELDVTLIGGGGASDWVLKTWKQCCTKDGFTVNCVDTEEAAFRQIVFEVENGTVDVYRQPLKAGMGNPASQTLDVETGSAIFTQDETHGVVANATRFFRETRSFRALEQLIVPEHMANTPQQRFTLWSAACSRGAEAYSYAMYLVNLLSAYPAPCPFHVLATDINASLVEKAREGVFKPSRTDLDRYKAVFSRHGMIDGDVLTFGDEIKRHITFKSFDLKQAPKKQFRFRVIICANMFQYYEDDARAHFLTNLVSALDRPGYLYVGALSAPMAEQFGLHRISEFGIYRVG